MCPGGEGFGSQNCPEGRGGGLPTPYVSWGWRGLKTNVAHPPRIISGTALRLQKQTAHLLLDAAFQSPSPDYETGLTKLANL